MPVKLVSEKQNKSTFLGQCFNTCVRIFHLAVPVDTDKPDRNQISEKQRLSHEKTAEIN